MDFILLPFLILPEMIFAWILGIGFNRFYKQNVLLKKPVEIQKGYLLHEESSIDKYTDIIFLITLLMTVFILNRLGLFHIILDPVNF